MFPLQLCLEFTTLFKKVGQNPIDDTSASVRCISQGPGHLTMNLSTKKKILGSPLALPVVQHPWRGSIFIV